MTPTPFLRFVERAIRVPVRPTPETGPAETTEHVRVLQQFFRDELGHDAVEVGHFQHWIGRWRDVPLVKES